MKLSIKNHKLVGIPYKHSPNQSGFIKPKYLVVHYTAGRSAESAITTLTTAARKASAHLVIGRDGSVTQLVPFNKKSWHAGTSEWKGLSGLNAYSIGIELDNAGKLTKTAGGAWKTWFGATIDPNDVLVAKHKNGGPLSGWHTYTPEQMEALEEVGALLFDKYGLEDAIGHDDIAPGRKTDPGPAFNMGSFRSLMVGRHNEDPELEHEPEPAVVVPDFIFYDPSKYWGDLVK